MALPVIGLTFVCNAEAIELPSFITDSMVVQQNSVLRITGMADGAVEAVPSWAPSKVKSTVGNDGTFSIELPTPPAGGPFSINFTAGDSSVTISDVYSGEVWLCSGQSNMEMPVGGWGKVADYEAEIASANYPKLRLLQISKTVSPVPCADVSVNMGGWHTASPSTVENFSSIGYFFGRDLSARLGDVPVGIIDCTWGGTPVEAWSSLGGVASVPGFEDEIRVLTEADGDPERMKAINESQQAYWLDVARAEEVQVDPAVLSRNGTAVRLPQHIEQALGRSIDGIFWLQREVDIPLSMAGKDLEINLGKIDDEDVTCFNGVEIGRMSGYDTPRHYTVPGSLVKEGRALISVKVTDYSGEGGLWGDEAGLNISDGVTTLTLAGDWTFTLGVDFGMLPRRPMSIASSSYPTVLYNAMFAPLKDFPVKGVLWYQGCANVGRDEQYSSLFKRLITDWRALRNQPDMPFFFMQLAAYLKPQQVQPYSEWAALRSAQADALELPGVYMASAIDIGDANDIHPKNKQEAARRFLNLALNKTYGHDVECEAPTPVNFVKAGFGCNISFNADVFVDGKDCPSGFIVLLDNGTWQRGNAVRKDKRTIYVDSADGFIEEVRYNWADFPDGNLRGANGLPVVPFKKEIMK